MDAGVNQQGRAGWHHRLRGRRAAGDACARATHGFIHASAQVEERPGRRPRDRSQGRPGRSSRRPVPARLPDEKKVVTTAVFAALATWVRPAGVFLVFPLAWAAFELFRNSEIRPKDWRIGVPIVAALAPMAAFGTWNQWVNIWNSLTTGVDKTMAPGGGYQYYGGGQLSSASMVYLTLELLSLALAVVATVWLVRRVPGVALFGPGVLVLSFGSSATSPQGMDRYVLAVPAIFLMLAWFGRRAVVDRVWVLASALLMGVLATLFTFGFWVS